jgi:hypothetical protein
MQTAAERVSKDSPPQKTMDRRRDPGAVRAAFQRSAVPGPAGAPRPFRRQQRAALDPAVGEDRRLLRGLRLLLAGGAPPYRAGKGVLLEIDEVVAAAQAAKEKGASRFCMGAAWRGPKDKDLEQVSEMIRAVKALGLETCVTLGMLKEGQAEKLKAAGLDYYNHNLDTAPEFYGNHRHHPQPGRPLRHARQGARRRHQRLLRRHRRHGRDARQPRQPDRRAGQHESAAGIRADQQPGAGAGHAAGRMPSRSIPSSSCAPSPRRASPCRRASCACRPVARR